jgi:hypothetical protein
MDNPKSRRTNLFRILGILGANEAKVVFFTK